MIEISLNNVVKEYGTFVVFKELTFDIVQGEKVAIIGENGSGKTTLFKILMGREDCSGSLAINKNATLGYMEQIPEYHYEASVNDIIRSAFKQLLDTKDKLDEMEKLMASGKEVDEQLLEKYGDLQTIFETKGGYEINTRIDNVCMGLKISNAQREKDFRKLSGGEKRIVALAKILLEAPDILLLDEPTNHLDIESVEWLEGYLREYTGTALIVSHDRYFLDKIAGRVIKLEGGYCDLYKGNYSQYKKEEEQRLLSEFHAYKEQKKKIKAMKEAIVRFREWGKNADDHRFFKKAFQIEKRLEKMEILDKPQMEKKKIALNLKSGSRSGKDVLVLKDIEKAFNRGKLLKGINLHMRFREKVALLGTNGCGKSTLFKIIMSLAPLDKGSVKLSETAKIGYLEQDIVFPDEEKTLLDHFRDIFPYDETHARWALAGFLFVKDDVFKQIKDLSGGEKTRLKLCQIMNSDINFLILDEPTNHLDIDSREILEDALLDFGGTVLYISHDRYFINKTAGRIVEIVDGRLNNYDGNYNYYKQCRERTVSKGVIVEKPEEKKIADTPRHNDRKAKKENKPDYMTQRKINEVEQEIENTERKIENVNKEIEKHYADYQKAGDLFTKKKELEEHIAGLMEKWEDLNER